MKTKIYAEIDEEWIRRKLGAQAAIEQLWKEAREILQPKTESSSLSNDDGRDYTLDEEEDYDEATTTTLEMRKTTMVMIASTHRTNRKTMMMMMAATIRRVRRKTMMTTLATTRLMMRTVTPRQMRRTVF